jgi:ATP-dependent Clp protease ATP-binding subunit ClpA
MFERFTKEARRVVVAAVEEAGKRGDTRVGTEHLLLGVFGSDWDRLSVLESSGLTDQALRLQLDAMEDQALQAVGIDRRSIDAGLAGSPPLARRRRHLPFTGGAKNVLKGALVEAIALEHRFIAIEHIVLALNGLPPQDRVTRILQGVGVDAGDLRAALITSLRRAS